MSTKIKLLAVNVALAALASFLGALAYAQQVDAEVQYDAALLITAGYAALRTAIGLGSVYADRLATEVRTKTEKDLGF